MFNLNKINYFPADCPIFKIITISFIKIIVLKALRVFQHIAKFYTIIANYIPRYVTQF